MVWSPGRLAEIAVRVPMSEALVGAVAAVGLEIASVTWATLAPGMVRSWSWAGMVGSVVSAMVFGVCLAWVATVAVGSVLEWTARSDKDRAVARVLLLSPLPWTCPVLMWSALAMLGSMRGSAMAPSPSWEGWPGVEVLGSRWWFLGVAIAYVWLLRHAAWRLDQLFARGAAACPGCGYDLRGLEEEERCPECGRARGHG